MNIFAYLFRVHGAMGLSRHGQVCLARLRFGDTSLVGPNDGGGGYHLGGRTACWASILWGLGG